MQNLQYDYLDERYQNLTILGNEEKKSTYLAKDNVTGQIVVKKYVHAESANVYEQLKKINSTHLANVLYVAIKNEKAFVIMEYISGQTIEELQKKQMIFTEKETIDYIIQVLQILSTIHKLGIVHRDINPKNILISMDGIVKLLDFDIGRYYKVHQGSDTMIMGTVGYAAPEQFGFLQSDKRTDIYALGILMNVMLTGKLPKDYPYSNGRMGYIIQNCIWIDPERRYQATEEIIQEMEWLRNIELQQGNKVKQLQNKIERKRIGRKDPIKKCVWPGFRTGKMWKKILASVYYTLIGVDMVMEFLMNVHNPLTALLYVCTMSIMCLWSVLFALNFMNWMDHVYVIRKFDKGGKIIVGIIIFFVLLYVGMSFEKYVLGQM